MLDLAWRPRAHLDRESIALSLGFERGNPEAAWTVMRSIDEALDRVRRFPEIGRTVEIDGLAHGDYRRVLADRHAVFYRYDDRGVVVYRILHQRQDIDVRSLVDFSEE